VGVGAQDDFEYGQDFLDTTGITELTMLWERSGVIWNINNVRVNSAMQLYSYDLSQQSGLIFFNNDGREIVLSASPQEPWAAPGGSTSQ
jgi:hypothetical protein